MSKKKTDPPLRKRVIRHCSALAIIFAFIIAVITLPSFLNGEKWRETYSYYALNHGLYWVAILYLIWIILSNDPPDTLGIPKVKSIRADGLIIAEHMNWLSLGVMAAVYLNQDDIEKLVCVAEVVNVQSNGLIQIQIRQHDQGFASIDAAKDALSQASKSDILIKPGLYRRG